MNKEIRIIPWSDIEPYHARKADNLNQNSAAFAVAACGAAPKTDAKRFMLMLSRMTRHIKAEDKWLSAAIGCIDELADNRDCTLVCSSGMTCLDFVTWYGAKREIALWIVFPPGYLKDFDRNISDVVLNLKIKHQSVTFFQPLLEHREPKAVRLHLRDQLMYQFSHLRFPISVRRGGYWDSLISQGMETDRTFQVDHPGGNKSPWTQLRDRLIKTAPELPSDLLVHWTRGAYKPWPGETGADYFEALCASDAGNPRDGFSTLKQILESGVLRGAGNLIRGGFPVLAFSSLEVQGIIRLIRYRSTLGHWNYEPYGIGLPIDSMRLLGAEPVIYGDKSDYKELRDDQKPFFQYSGRNTAENEDSSQNKDVNRFSTRSQFKSDSWVDESEWRVPGDLDLTSVADSVIVFVPTAQEAEALKRSTIYNVIPLIKET